MQFIKKIILSMFNGCEMRFIDKNKTKTVWYKWYKNSTFKFMGNEYVIDKQRVENRQCYYHSNFVEPITFDFNQERTDYFITTKEFQRVYNNKLLTIMMYVSAKDYIKYILIISAVCLVCSLYGAAMLYDMNAV